MKRQSFRRSANPASFTIMLSFKADILAFCAYTKRIDFLFFCVFSKPKPSGVILGSRRQAYGLNILENRRKGGHFEGACRPLPLLLSYVLHVIYGPILLRNVSIFSFSVGFSENQRLLELVWVAGTRAISSIYWKMGERR